MRLGREDAGRFVFEQLAAIQPPDAGRLAGYACCLHHLGQVEAADAAYRSARELAPGDARIAADHGRLLRASGHRGAAIAAFRASLALDAHGGHRSGGLVGLLQLAALHRDAGDLDPLPFAARALATAADSDLLRQSSLDVTLDRLDRAAAAVPQPARSTALSGSGLPTR